MLTRKNADLVSVPLAYYALENPRHRIAQNDKSSEHAPMRAGVACFVFLALAGALNASSIGVAINGVCENASCPPGALALIPPPVSLWTSQ
jgi:hypothetical protein